MTIVYELEPLRGVGPISIGMSRVMVEGEFSKLGSYRPLQQYNGSTEIYLDNPTMSVGLSAGAELVEYVGFSHSQRSAYSRELCLSCREEATLSPFCDYQVMFRGLDMFHTVADQLVAALMVDELAEDEEGTSWVSRRLQLGLWREDPSLPFFQSVLIGRNGYYS